MFLVPPTEERAKMRSTSSKENNCDSFFETDLPAFSPPTTCVILTFLMVTMDDMECWFGSGGVLAFNRWIVLSSHCKFPICTVVTSLSSKATEIVNTNF